MRKVMDGGFRRIKAAPVVAEQDPRLALVDLFRGSQVFRPEGMTDPSAPLPEGVIDLSSGDAPDYSALFAEDSLVDQAMDLMSQPLDQDAQEPAGEPEPDADDNAPQEASEAADEAPADAEPVEKDEAPEQKQDEQDYDPIAAVLG